MRTGRTGSWRGPHRPLAISTRGRVPVPIHAWWRHRPRDLQRRVPGQIDIRAPAPTSEQWTWRPSKHGNLMTVLARRGTLKSDPGPFKIIFLPVLAETIQARTLAGSRQLQIDITVRNRRSHGNLLEPLYLLLVRAGMTELVANDRASMRYQRTNHILFQPERQIEIRPRLVAVLERGHAEDKVVEILNVAVTFALVAQADDE